MSPQAQNGGGRMEQALIKSPNSSLCKGGGPQDRGIFFSSR